MVWGPAKVARGLGTAGSPDSHRTGFSPGERLFLCLSLQLGLQPWRGRGILCSNPYSQGQPVSAHRRASGELC